MSTSQMLACKLNIWKKFCICTKSYTVGGDMHLAGLQFTVMKKEEGVITCFFIEYVTVVPLLLLLLLLWMFLILFHAISIDFLLPYLPCSSEEEKCPCCVHIFCQPFLGHMITFSSCLRHGAPVQYT